MSVRLGLRLGGPLRLCQAQAWHSSAQGSGDHMPRRPWLWLPATQPVGCTRSSWGRAGALPDPAALHAFLGGCQAVTVPQDW